MGRVIYAAPLQLNVSCSSRNNHIKGGQQPAALLLLLPALGCGFFFPSSSSSLKKKGKHCTQHNKTRNFPLFFYISYICLLLLYIFKREKEVKKRP
jgi:hypothetical protein